MRPQGEIRTLLVDLTPAELEEMGGKLAEAIQEEDAERVAFTAWWASALAAKKVRQGKVEALHQAASALAETVSRGSVEKDVECSWLYSLGAGWAFLVRDDTGEKIAHRQLKDEERQVDLTESLREPTPEQLGRWMADILLGGVEDASFAEVEGVPGDRDEDDEEPQDGDLQDHLDALRAISRVEPRKKKKPLLEDTPPTPLSASAKEAFEGTVDL